MNVPDETVEVLSNRLSLDSLFSHMEIQKEINKGLKDSLLVANHEMGAIQIAVGEIKTDISWMREKLDKTDTRTWTILTTIILGTILQIAFILWKK